MDEDELMAAKGAFRLAELYYKWKENLKIGNEMKKKVYVTPEVDAVVLLQQDMLCGSGNGMDIHDDYSDAEQLSNKNVWDDIW